MKTTELKLPRLILRAQSALEDVCDIRIRLNSALLPGCRRIDGAYTTSEKKNTLLKKEPKRNRNKDRNSRTSD